MAEAVTGPVVVLAGAGAGKTRAVTHRIGYAVATGAQPAEHGLAVTFTSKAAGEMRDRLSRLGVAGVQAMTFHSAALRQLRHFWPRVVGGSPPDLIGSKVPVVAEAAASCGVAADRTLLRDLASEIEWAKVSRVSPEGFAAASGGLGRDMPGALDAQEVARVYGTYGDLMAERGRMDFEDVLLLTVAMLEDQPAVAEQIRSRYRWFTVDEYQDVSVIQHDLLDLWLGERREVCVVGDPAQTIYSFAGATSRYLTSFESRFPDATAVRLDRTYRCSPQIAACANGLLAASRDPQGRRHLRLVSQTQPGPRVEVTAHDNEISEAEAVAGAISRHLSSGTPPREVAVLFRTNSASQALEEALAEAGVPYQVSSGERFFERPEIREAMVRLRATAADSPESPIVEAAGEVLAAMSFAADQPPSGRGARRDRWESLAALHALAAELAGGKPAAAVPDLVAELERRAQLQSSPGAAGITLSSLHAAKGLEWDVVFLVGVSEGTLPIIYATTPEQVEEERRLLYVGITRARRELRISWSRNRPGGGRRRPSRFLRDLAGTADGLDEGSNMRSGGATSPRRRPRHKGPGRCRLCGKALVTAPEAALARCRTCPADVDADLLDRLREWRRTQAQKRSAPAYTVFTDKTLQAVAEIRPLDLDALAEIPGVGAVKLDRWGEELLEMVRAATSP